MARMYLAILYVFVGTVVVSAADEKQDYVEQNFRMSDAFNDPLYSSVLAAKNGFRVFTNPPEHGITETLTVTHSDGLYVAGEKVITESEHRRVVSELHSTRDELHGIRDMLNLTRKSLKETQSEVIALLQALREVAPANNSRILQPPTCKDPGGDKLHFNGTHWECVCKDGFIGASCDVTAPTTTPTSTRSAPTAGETSWEYLGQVCCREVDSAGNDVYSGTVLFRTRWDPTAWESCLDHCASNAEVRSCEINNLTSTCIGFSGVATKTHTPGCGAGPYCWTRVSA